MLVHELILHGHPEATALIDKNTRYTYGQLQAEVGQYRDYLYARGIRKNDHVGLLAKNSAGFIFSYLAVTSLGAVIVPLNNLLTKREIDFILANARVKFLITDQDLSGTSILTIAGINAALKQGNYPPAPYVSLTASDPCVILYTSGTTGQPKGAVLSHRNLQSNVDDICNITNTGPADHFLCVLPMFHSFAWSCCVLAPLYRGAQISIVETFSPKEVITLIRQSGITVVIGVPAMYSYYAQLARPEDLAGVRLFVSGGAALPLEVSDRFFAGTKKRIIEGYGLSEASPVVTFNRLRAVKPGSIGLPLPSVAVKIVTDTDRIANPREVGELVVRGPNVMTGYYNAPAETAVVLRDGWLYTGDLAYQDEEGYVYLVDRKKDLFIVSGLNVYPREVEEVLFQFPGIKDAAVIGVPDSKRGEVGRAFIVVADGYVINKKDLQAFLKANLAVYKRPREIIELPALPKSATGKVLKKDLREKF
ncbi:MAG: long-chain fatty acid--CoA ligase [Heliobacteriaceae bacterium]|nr:long-chain fatty acid--CoA ligase [Heliobacteriaceae bacterium]